MKPSVPTIICALTICLFVSCQKGFTDESSTIPVPIPPVEQDGTDCKITRVEAMLPDKTGGYVTYYLFTDNGLPARCYEKDTISGNGIYDWQISISGNRMNFIYNQWVEFDAKGNITKSDAYEVLDDNTSARLVGYFHYDSSGQLASYYYELASMPGITQDSIVQTWVNGNVVKIDRYNISGRYSVHEIDFDETKTAKNFLVPTLSEEIYQFYPLIPYGKKNKNLPVKQYLHHHAADGSLEDELIRNYSGYQFDASGNVKSFRVSFTDGVSSGVNDIKLDYRCF